MRINRLIVRVKDSFEAAHRLPFLGESHKCYYLHGHSYKVTLEIIFDFPPNVDCQEVLKEKGFLIDFSEAKRMLKEITGKIDHTLLIGNKEEVEPVKGIKVFKMDVAFSTSELIAIFIVKEFAKKLNQHIAKLELGNVSVKLRATVCETKNNSCTIEAEL